MARGSIQNLKPLSKEDPRLYHNWLKALSPEEREQHLIERKNKVTMKQAMKEQLQSQQDMWLNALVAAGKSVLERAQTQGDPQAFSAIWDRVVGKPETTMDIKVEQDDTTDDIMKKLQASSLQSLEDREATVSLPSPQQSINQPKE